MIRLQRGRKKVGITNKSRRIINEFWNEDTTSLQTTTLSSFLIVFRPTNQERNTTSNLESTTYSCLSTYPPTWAFYHFLVLEFRRMEVIIIKSSWFVVKWWDLYTAAAGRSEIGEYIVLSSPRTSVSLFPPPHLPLVSAPVHRLEKVSSLLYKSMSSFGKGSGKRDVAWVTSNVESGARIKIGTGLYSLAESRGKRTKELQDKLEWVLFSG